MKWRLVALLVAFSVTVQPVAAASAALPGGNAEASGNDKITVTLTTDPPIDIPQGDVYVCVDDEPEPASGSCGDEDAWAQAGGEVAGIVFCVNTRIDGDPGAC